MDDNNNSNSNSNNNNNNKNNNNKIQNHVRKNIQLGSSQNQQQNRNQHPRRRIQMTSGSAFSPSQSSLNSSNRSTSTSSSFNKSNISKLSSFTNQRKEHLSLSSIQKLQQSDHQQQQDDEKEAFNFDTESQVTTNTTISIADDINMDGTNKSEASSATTASTATTTIANQKNKSIIVTTTTTTNNSNNKLPSFYQKHKSRQRTRQNEEQQMESSSLPSFLVNDNNNNVDDNNDNKYKRVCTLILLIVVMTGATAGILFVFFMFGQNLQHHETNNHHHHNDVSTTLDQTPGTVPFVPSMPASDGNHNNNNNDIHDSMPTTTTIPENPAPSVVITPPVAAPVPAPAPTPLSVDSNGIADLATTIGPPPPHNSNNYGNGNGNNNLPPTSGEQIDEDDSDGSSSQNPGNDNSNNNNNNSITNTDSPYLVGVYYYPWHKKDFHNNEGYLRKELQPEPQFPYLGEYDDSQPDIIAQHFVWSRQANVRLWVTSWWGPNHVTDHTTRDVIMDHEDMSNANIRIALHYETNGRLGRRGYNSTIAEMDMEYICQRYFGHSTYYRIHGRPVIFLYLARALDRLDLLADIMLTMRRAARRQCGENVYIVGDHVFQNPPRSEPNTIVYNSFMYLDAVTNYDVYGAMGRPVGYAGTGPVDEYYDEQSNWRSIAHFNGCRYIPAVSPGYNDRGVRFESDHPPLSRRLTENGEEGSLFAYQISKAIQLVDPLLDNLIMVNSFNEWHEDTQIEPAVGNPATEPFNLTFGLEYVGYNDLYLNILRDGTTTTTTTTAVSTVNNQDDEEQGNHNYNIFERSNFDNDNEGK